MITIFYSTRKENKYFQKEIYKSCRLKNVEIVEFVNAGTHSLAQAYNIALEKAKYDIVVCIHDDIELERGWDEKIYNYFNSSDYAILGMAGTTDLDESGIWWNVRHRMVGNVWHWHGEKWNPTPYSNTYKNMILPVVCIDGLFMAVSKSRIKVGFDESFKGFHYYDIPFCVANHLLGVKIGVVTDIVIRHKSIGVPNEQWAENKAQFLQSFGNYLPLNVIPEKVVDSKGVSISNEPKLAIIIPTKNNFQYLLQCVESIFNKSSYKNFNIYIADTGSDNETFDNYAKHFGDLIRSGKIKLTGYNFYNFAKINNAMVKDVIDKDTELLLFCNDDIKLVNDAISLMTAQYIKHKNNVGTIGCRLYYADDSVQHGGIQGFITKNNQFGLSHFGLRSYYRASFEKEYDVFGNTGAFLMISKDRFYAVDGFEDKTQECMEDVVLNMDCILKGYKNIYVGQAVCYHYESVTRKQNPMKTQGERNDMQNYVVPKIMSNINTFKKYLTIYK